MPIYEYECTKCGCVEEAIQKFSDKPLKKCKQCSGKLHRLISQSNFHLKGTGWYVTDYASKSKNSSQAGGQTAGQDSNRVSENTGDKSSNTGSVEAKADTGSKSKKSTDKTSDT